MIQILINNEALDIDADTLVTFKKAQMLNGIQSPYSFSNNFSLKASSKNMRLLGINYLPNSKAKSMTAGYDVDVILNGCIFLKRQKLKVQKETPGSIPVYLIFTDSFLVAKAKEVLMNQIDLGVIYNKNLANFVSYNSPLFPHYRTAPISAQDQSGFVAVEEVPALLNIKQVVIKIFEQLGYAYTGDILTDEHLAEYYMSSNVGVYGADGTPHFAETLTVYDFLLSFLETFNGYIDISDSSKSLGLYFWKNIETIKANFVDYTDKFVGFSEYAFEGGLAKVNTLEYSDSPDFYNGFFNNNKSIVDKTEYLNSEFGAGNLRLFADQELGEHGDLPLRTEGETTEPQTMNLFRFEAATTLVPLYSGGDLLYLPLYKAFSPNIFEIWQRYHQPYCANISLPTIGLLDFRHDAIFLAEFKMSRVFFIKQLSTYWLPLELNYNTEKNGVQVKALMIEKTAVDVPVVFDQSLSVGFHADVFILDIAALYSAQNTSPAATMVITAADLTKNNIYVNGIQILSFPASIDVSAGFEFKVENIEAVNAKNNSNVLFRFISQEGGVSREATINVAHNGYANFVTAFRSEPGTTYHYGQDDVDSFDRWLNYAVRVVTPLDIADSFVPAIGEEGSIPAAATAFKALDFQRDSTVTVELTIAQLVVHCSNRGGGARAQTNVTFFITKNGAHFLTIYSGGSIDNFKTSSGLSTYNNVAVSKTFSVLAGDDIAVVQYISGIEEDRIGSGTMDGSLEVKDITWKFKVTEQL